jgi:serine carboxypeptidase-like clade 4
MAPPRTSLAVVLSLALAAVATATPLGSVDDPALLRMGAGARRVSERLVEKDLAPLEMAHGVSSAPTPFERSSGYFELNRTSAAEMFYFYFRARHDAGGSAPVVLWMTGGPGCSSELALFAENGPYAVGADGETLSVNEHGWDQVSNLIYVDQPIGTGFSYSTDPKDDVHDEKRVAEDMLQFLSEFSDAHPELKGRDFFVTGESYAGHYVPAVSYAVFEAQARGEGPAFPLKGLAIGNGLTEPEIQYGAYADYALGVDLVTSEDAAEARAVYPKCAAMIRACGEDRPTPDGPSGESPGRVALCEAAVAFCQTIPSSLLEAAGDVNVYDVRKPCAVPGLCYDFSRVERFLNLPGTRAALGVGERAWQACSPTVHADMMADWMRDLEPVIPPMLEGGLRVLVYAGEDDFICNWLGNRRWVEAMPWSGREAFAAQYPQPFVVDGHTGGDVIESGKLSFLKMSESGHMVPMDQPANALEMLRRFTAGEPMKGEDWAPGCCGDAAEETAETAGSKLRRSKPFATLRAPRRAVVAA